MLDWRIIRMQCTSRITHAIHHNIYYLFHWLRQPRGQLKGFCFHLMLMLSRHLVKFVFCSDSKTYDGNMCEPTGRDFETLS